MRKADLVNIITEKTGVPKVDVLVTLEMFFKEVKNSLSQIEDNQKKIQSAGLILHYGRKVVKKLEKKVFWLKEDLEQIFKDNLHLGELLLILCEKKKIKMYVDDKHRILIKNSN